MAYITIAGSLADLLGSQRIQELADAAAAGGKTDIELRIDAPSAYHQDKAFVGRVNPPLPVRSFHVQAVIEFRETGRTVEDARRMAIDALEDSDFIGSYRDVLVTDDSAEILAP